MADLGKSGENAKKLNKELNATNEALNKANSTSAQLTEETRSLTEELKDQLGIRSKNNEGEKALLSLSRQITKSSQENKVQLREQGDITNQIKKDVKSLDSANRELLITKNSILGTDKELNELIQGEANAIVEANSARLKSLSIIDGLKTSMIGKSDQELQSITNQIAAEQSKLSIAEESLSAAIKNSDEESQRLALSQQLVNSAGKNLKETQNQEAAQERINKSLGLAGNAAKVLEKTLGGFAGAIGIKDVADDMKRFATEAEDAGKSVSRLRVAGVGLSSAFKNLGKTLSDPVVIVGALIKGFTTVDKEATDFARQTGQDINTMSTSIDSLNMGYVNMADYIRAASTVTKELGMNAANIFSKEDILEVAQMTDEIGLSGKEAANLAKFSKLNGTSIESQNKALDKGRVKFNAQNKSVITGRKVLDDVASTSNSIAVSYAGYPGKLGEAATAAANLGLNLEGVDKIASSLLDFESSISAELEAELITGKSLNLEKARQAALDNDLATLGKEISKNIGTAADFAKMNRKEQEALAKAVGMTKDELAGSLINQEIGKTLSEDQLTDAQKQTYEAFKNREAQEKISQAIAKIGQAFAPIVGFVADIVSNSYVLYGLMGAALLTRIGGIGKAISGIGGGFSKAATSLGKMKKGAGEFFDKIKGFKPKEFAKGLKESFGMGANIVKDARLPSGYRDSKTGQAVSKKLGDKAFGAGEGIAKTADKTKGIKPDAGNGIKGFLKGLGDGLASIGKQFGNVVKGAAALGITGLVLGGSFALAMNMVKDVDPAQMLAFAGSLSAIGLTVALMGKMGGSIIKGALAMGILGVGLIPAAYAFSLLEGVDPKSMLAFAAALPILGLSVLGLGLIFSNPFTAILFGLGIIGLVALGAALIPLASAFGKIGDAIKGNEIEQTFSSLFKLSSIAPGIEATAAALHSIADGLGAIADEGTAALPILKELNALGGSADGGGGENSEMAQVNANLERLISLVEQGGDVFIDGSKVGKSLQLASSKIG